MSDPPDPSASGPQPLERSGPKATILTDGHRVWGFVLAVWFTVVSIILLGESWGESPAFLGLLAFIGSTVAAWVGLWAWIRERWVVALLAYCVVALSPWMFPFLLFASILAAFPMIVGALRRREAA